MTDKASNTGAPQQSWMLWIFNAFVLIWMINKNKKNPISQMVEGRAAQATEVTAALRPLNFSELHKDWREAGVSASRPRSQSLQEDGRGTESKRLEVQYEVFTVWWFGLMSSAAVGPVGFIKSKIKAASTTNCTDMLIPVSCLDLNRSRQRGERKEQQTDYVIRNSRQLPGQGFEKVHDQERHQARPSPTGMKCCTMETLTCGGGIFSSQNVNCVSVCRI